MIMAEVCVTVLNIASGNFAIMRVANPVNATIKLAVFCGIDLN